MPKRTVPKGCSLPGSGRSCSSLPRAALPTKLDELFMDGSTMDPNHKNMIWKLELNRAGELLRYARKEV